MRYHIYILVAILILSCTDFEKKQPFTSIEIETLYEDSISVRAIEIMGNNLAFAANNGVFGSIDLGNGKIRTNVEKYYTSIPEFRAVAHTSTDFFMLSVGNPALLYKTGNEGRMDLVYKEEGKGVFYDAMTFWNDLEGIAVGDSVEGCLSVIITRDGGSTWKKLDCSELPEGIEGEGAFAASNSNIAIAGEKVWMATTEGRIYYSPDKGRHWEIQKTPMVKDEPTQGIYSIAFYDGDLGFAIGGDYTQPDNNQANKAITVDGGLNWKIIAEGQEPDYKSCVQFVPGSEGDGIVTVGFTGISYSEDRGHTWLELSEEPFYTFRFANDSVAFAGGNGRIARLIFR